MTIPNLLTIGRFFLIPVFVAVFYSSREDSLLLAMLVFLAAGATDLLDGYIARRYDMITEIGTLLDPLADKLMLITVMICMALENFFPFWIVIIIVIKETVMIGGGVYLYYSHRNIVIPANWLGKAATAAFYGAIVLLSIGGGGIGGRIAVYIAVALAALAFINYQAVVFREMKKIPKS